MDEVAPYKQCLNCGTELQGRYCHKCGQQASNPTPKVWKFILEYMDNAFIWDQKCLPTIWYLISRPGYLTNEFNNGKFVAHENPLKLNMFFLLMFVTIFFFFSDIQEASDSFDNLTKNELVHSYLCLSALKCDVEYSTKMVESQRDTIKLSLPLVHAKEFPNIITTLQAFTDYNGEKSDTLLVSIPKILIQDGILMCRDSDVYSFSDKNGITKKAFKLDLISNLWRKLLDILTQYFPLIFLLTSPLLAIAVKCLYAKRRMPFISFFIFALHYTAFIEFVMLVIYLLYLTIQPSFRVLEWIMNVSSCLYLTVAVKNVYVHNSWIKSIIKALLISFIYLSICFSAFFVIFIIALFIVLI